MTPRELQQAEIEISNAETTFELDGIVTDFLMREEENDESETYIDAAYRLDNAGQGEMARLLRQANTKWFELEG